MYVCVWDQENILLSQTTDIWEHELISRCRTLPQRIPQERKGKSYFLYYLWLSCLQSTQRCWSSLLLKAHRCANTCIVRVVPFIKKKSRVTWEGAAVFLVTSLGFNFTFFFLFEPKKNLSVFNEDFNSNIIFLSLWNKIRMLWEKYCMKNGLLLRGLNRPNH